MIMDKAKRYNSKYFSEVLFLIFYEMMIIDFNCCLAVLWISAKIIFKFPLDVKSF